MLLAKCIEGIKESVEKDSEKSWPSSHISMPVFMSAEEKHWGKENRFSKRE